MIVAAGIDRLRVEQQQVGLVGAIGRAFGEVPDPRGLADARPSRNIVAEAHEALGYHRRVQLDDRRHIAGIVELIGDQQVGPPARRHRRIAQNRRAGLAQQIEAHVGRSTARVQHRQALGEGQRVAFGEIPARPHGRLVGALAQRVELGAQIGRRVAELRRDVEMRYDIWARGRRATARSQRVLSGRRDTIRLAKPGQQAGQRSLLLRGRAVLPISAT